MKKHKSHYIFALIGLLFLLFVAVFGIGYFYPEYSFKEVESVDNTHSYYDGISTENPFEVDLESRVEVDPLFDPFVEGQDNLTVSIFNNYEITYPSKYVVAKEEGRYVLVKSLQEYYEYSNCSSIEIEEDRIRCQYAKIISPYITISQIDSIDFDYLDYIDTIRFGSYGWDKYLRASEYGQVIAYRADIDGDVLEFRLRAEDSPGGQIFEKKDIYELSAAEQEELLLSILESFTVQS